MNINYFHFSIDTKTSKLEPFLMCFPKIVCTNLVLTMTVLITDPDPPSIDIVEAGLNFAGVEEESCR